MKNAHSQGGSSGGSQHALITGVTSQIGQFLMARLLDTGYTMTVFSRSPRLERLDERIQWVQRVIGDDSNFGQFAGDAFVLFHLGPLELLPGLIKSVAGSSVKRIVAFGSTSQFTKARLRNQAEALISAQLAESEKAIAETCASQEISWTIFKPTIIYGGGGASGLAFVGRLITQLGIFPVVGRGKGLRQPVHADDLAGACLSVLDCSAAFNRSYILGGGEVLSYREMIERIFRYLGRPPRILNVPLPFYRFAIRMASLLPRCGHLTPDMADRIMQNHSFDIGNATRDFGYSPRKFLSDLNGNPQTRAETEL